MLPNNLLVKYFLFVGIIFMSILGFNSCKKEMYQGTIEPDIIHTSKLYIDSDPKSLKIYLDDNFLGAVSPDSVNWLPDGDHKISLKHDLYPDTTFYLNLIRSEKTSIYIDGFANPHFYNTIYVESEPKKAKIVFNDSIINDVTPFYIKHLLPDTYKIKVMLPAHRPDSTEVVVKKGITKNVKLILEDTTKFITYKTNNSGINSNYVTAVAVDKNNLVWIGTVENGIVTFDGKRWKEIIIPGKNNIFQISKMEFDKFNRLWVKHSGGLLMYDNSTWYNYNQEVGTGLINDFTFDSSGNILIATALGLYYKNGNNWKVYNTANDSGITSNTINTVFISSSGSIWLGTDNFASELRHGSSNFSGRNPIDQIDPTISPNIKIVFENASNDIWFYHRTIDRDHRNALSYLQRYTWSEGSIPYVNYNELNAVYIEKDNGVWFCKNSGVALRRLDNSVLNISQTNSGFPIRQCMQMIKDYSGNYWIACLGYGLVQIKNGTIK